jgi:cell division septum initiation protein DivIVA
VPDTESTKPLRLVSLEASAFKRLRAVSITFPAGEPVVTISGRNGQGKSSVLDAIAAALGGGSCKPDKPVRRGHKKAEIIADLGEIVVKRTFTESGGGSLTVEAADGSKLSSPQAVLDRLYASLAFDPLAFVRMEPRHQVAELQRVAGLTETFAAIEAERGAAVSARGEAVRTVRTLEVTLEGLPDVPGPDAEVSVATLAAELQAANETKARNAKGREWLKQQRAAAEDQRQQIAELEMRLDAVRKSLAEAEATIAKHLPVVEKMVDPDIAAITTRITTIEQDNALARRRKARAETLERLRTARDAERKADRVVEEITIKREVTLAEARLPVTGLGFTDQGVTLHGIPFEQASTAEQIRASVAMGLASNPRLKLMLVREGSLLDDESMRLLADIAAEHDAQVVVERVSSGEAVGVVIEDGEVAGVHTTEEVAR